MQIASCSCISQSSQSRDWRGAALDEQQDYIPGWLGRPMSFDLGWPHSRRGRPKPKGQRVRAWWALTEPGTGQSKSCNNLTLSGESAGFGIWIMWVLWRKKSYIQPHVCDDMHVEINSSKKKSTKENHTAKKTSGCSSWEWIKLWP